MTLLRTEQIMNLKHLTRDLVRKLTGTHIYRTLPRGIDVVEDIRRSLPRHKVQVIFDVGANEGQSATSFLPRFPTASIFCFEPVSATFETLRHKMAKRARVTCHQLALGAHSGVGEMVLDGCSDMFYLNDRNSTSPDVSTEQVGVTTLDEFCEREGIEQIDYLKIDTEGCDLAVLQGASQKLTAERIGMVEVEAGMTPTNSHHASLESLKSFLESHGYLLFGIYEQVPEWATDEPHLRRTNLVFVSQPVARDNCPRIQTAA